MFKEGITFILAVAVIVGLPTLVVLILMQEDLKKLELKAECIKTHTIEQCEFIFK